MRRYTTEWLYQTAHAIMADREKTDALTLSDVIKPFAHGSPTRFYCYLYSASVRPFGKFEWEYTGEPTRAVYNIFVKWLACRDRTARAICAEYDAKGFQFIAFYTSIGWAIAQSKKAGEYHSKVPGRVLGLDSWLETCRFTWKKSFDRYRFSPVRSVQVTREAEKMLAKQAKPQQAAPVLHPVYYVGQDGRMQRG